jgi:sialate O-acetylesterase
MYFIPKDRSYHSVGAILLLYVLPSLACATTTIAPLFTDHAVLQSSMAIPVWGADEPGRTVSLQFADQQLSAVADKDGHSGAKFSSLKPSSDGQTMTVAGSSTVKVNDILIGEVWLCSGQSNMQFAVGSAINGGKETTAANFPEIRHLTVTSPAADEPQSSISDPWVVCSPTTASRFSAAAYFFGREIHQRLNVPIGLIDASWGGTNIQAWTPRDVLAARPEGGEDIERQQKAVAAYDPATAQTQYQAALVKWEKDTKDYQAQQQAGKADGPAPFKPHTPSSPAIAYSRPCGLFNSQIAPLIPYAIRGVIWYQGEANASVGQAWRYRQMLPDMIAGWRKAWGEDEFPFIWVQLPNYDQGKLSIAWPCMRESMLDALSTPNSGMAVTIDLGEANNIHPHRKQEVGLRLALVAMHLAYGKDLVYSGPIFRKATFDSGQCTIGFQDVGGGLVCKGDSIVGFEMAGADKQFSPAQARIDGDNVVVSSTTPAYPVAVRYAWASNPPVSLYNKEGLPASPFRTDDWWVPGQIPAPATAPAK